MVLFIKEKKYASLSYTVRTSFDGNFVCNQTEQYDNKTRVLILLQFLSVTFAYDCTKSGREFYIPPQVPVSHWLRCSYYGGVLANVCSSAVAPGVMGQQITGLVSVTEASFPRCRGCRG